MPMAGTGLANAIKPLLTAELAAEFPVAEGGEAAREAFVETLADALGPAIVDYIKANAIVNLSTGTIS